MRFCGKCGKEIADGMTVCPDCSRLMETKNGKETISTTNSNNEKIWISVFSVLFVVFVVAVIVLLTSSGFNDAIDRYQFWTSDLGSLNATISESGAIEWKRNVEAAKDALTPFYAGIASCSILALATLVGDVILLVNRKKAK